MATNLTSNQELVTLKELVQSPEKCDALLVELDKIARDIYGYEGGLPIYNESDKARLREAIYRWANGSH